MTTAQQTFDFSRFTKKQLQVIAANAGLRKNWAPISIAEIRGMLSSVSFDRMRVALLRSEVDESDVDDLIIDVGTPGAYDVNDDLTEVVNDEADEAAEVADELFTPVKATRQVVKAAAPVVGNVSDVAAALAGLLASGGTNEARVTEIAQAIATATAHDAMGVVQIELQTDLARMKSFVKDAIAAATVNLPTQTIVQPVIGEPKKLPGLVHARFERVYKLASLRQNVMLVGPAGCGKTQLAEMVADALGLSFSFLSCSAGMSESQLQGWLLPTGDSGQFSYVPAAFVTAYENGGVFLLDEIDAADENLLLVINSALANGKFAIPQRYDNSVAKRHADFCMIAAANTYGNGADRVYAGRNQLDGATLDRFRTGMVTMGYDANVESALVDTEVLLWGAAIRAKIEANKLRRVMSTRVLINYTAQKNAGLTRSDWEESYFCDWSRDELSKVGR
jgi:MoxR-like ATPase/outer membrane murein-binding lipoprotein Lpp